jgi:SAM-dependent methyltransferase
MFQRLQAACSEWGSMEQWLSDDFLAHRSWAGPLDVLSVGSGTGDFDLKIMQHLVNRWRVNAYVAIDPNAAHNQVFMNKFQESGLNVKEFQILAQTFPCDGLSRRFDFVLLTHCLYYIPDRVQAIQAAVESLKDDGYLIIFHQTPLGINEIQRRFLKQAKGHADEMFSSRDVYRLFKELSLPFTFDIVDGILNISDCFVPDSPEGKKLMNFFLECRTDCLPEEFRGQTLDFIQEIAFEDGGHRVIFHPVGVFCVKKNR